MSKHYTLLLLLLVLLALPGIGQNDSLILAKHDSIYQQRIKKEKLFGVYIHTDLGDAFAQLNKLISPESKNKFKRVPEATAVKKLHFSFGRWMIYNWQFEEGSRFSHYLRKLGLFDPDDMARFVMTTYHRTLNKKPLEVKALLEDIRTNRERLKRERLRKGEVISKSVRKVEKPKTGN